MLLEGLCFAWRKLASALPGENRWRSTPERYRRHGRSADRRLCQCGVARRGGRALAEELYLGLREVADAFGTAIAGGDTNSWDGPLVISVTVLGEATMPVPVGRSGAKPGDWLMATGSFGGSIRAKHLDFTPRISNT